MTGETGSCHCGAVSIAVDFPAGARPHLCNCSICAMKGGVMFDVPLDALAVLAGEEHLRSYRFNTGVADHRFCAICGVHLFHRLRSDPTKYGINGNCFAGRGRFAFAAMPVHDGANAHPCDSGQGTRIAGTAEYTPVSQGDH